MADETAALKNNFLSRGFFRHRGYYNLSHISPENTGKIVSSRLRQTPAPGFWHRALSPRRTRPWGTLCQWTGVVG